MKVSLFKQFFSLTQPDFGSQVIYGASHFFHRARSYGSWFTYNEIIPRSEMNGGLFIGQIPIDVFRDTVVDKLFDAVDDKPRARSMVVSCNEGFELAGLGTPYNVVPCYTWSNYKIDHHHLPFTDFSADANYGLIIHTLERMLDVHNKGGTIYLHCKAGRGRSGLLAVLFSCLRDKEHLKQQLHAGIELESILKDTITKLKNIHPQLKVEGQKTALGLQVLSYYVSYWNSLNVDDISDSLGLFNQNNAPEIPANFLRSISQSPEYKFICDQAYKNPNIFPIIQKFTRSVYDNAEERERIAEAKNSVEAEDERKPSFNIEQSLRAVLAKMQDDEKKILRSLHDLYIEQESFIEALGAHSKMIQHLGFDLCNKIINSNVSHEQKKAWLTLTIECLALPSKQNVDNYLAAADDALNTGNAALRAIGLMMLIVGIAFIMITIAAACAATGGILGASLVIIAGVSFGGLGAGLGKILYDLGKPDGVAAASRQFMNSLESSSTDPKDGIGDDDTDSKHDALGIDLSVDDSALNMGLI